MTLSAPSWTCCRSSLLYAPRHCLALPSPSFSFPPSLLPVQMQRESSLIDLVVSTEGYLGDTVLLLSAPQMPSQEADTVSNGCCVLREILCRHAAMQNRSVPLCPRDSTTTHDTFSLDFFFFHLIPCFGEHSIRTCARTSSIPLCSCAVLHCEFTEAQSFL